MSDTGQGPVGPSDPMGGVGQPPVVPMGGETPVTPTETPGGWTPPPAGAPTPSPVEPVVPSGDGSGNPSGMGGVA